MSDRTDITNSSASMPTSRFRPFARRRRVRRRIPATFRRRWPARRCRRAPTTFRPERPKANPDPGQYLDLVFGRRQHLQRAASGPEPSLQPRPFVARRLHLVEGARRWRFVERHDGGKCAGLVSNPFNLRADWGPATYDVRNIGVISASMSCRSGKGQAFANGLQGFANGLVSGWSVNSIVTLQGGFPFTPQLSYNPSNNGDTRNPVRPFVNPEFHRPGDSRQSGAVVQSGGVSAAADQQRILWQSGTRHPDRPGPGDLGFFRAERHRHSRAADACNFARRSSTC